MQSSSCGWHDTDSGWYITGHVVDDSYFEVMKADKLANGDSVVAGLCDLIGCRSQVSCYHDNAFFVLFLLNYCLILGLLC